jgi:tryptophan synthase alpha chain
MLEHHIRKEREQKEILLMTHLVLGYPSFDANRRVIEQMVNAGVELIELQIPFSEPMSDGPVILKANDLALKSGTTVAACFDFAKEICAQYPQVAFLFMTYCNVMFMHGTSAFVAKAKELGVRGLIIPDLPPEEAEEYMSACEDQGIDPIFIFTPTNTKERLKELAKVGRGFIYCVGRRGVTGIKTQFDAELQNLIDSYKNATELPIALGFGIQKRADVDFLKGTVDIAVLGTQVMRIQDKDGIEAVGAFLQGLRT